MTQPGRSRVWVAFGVLLLPAAVALAAQIKSQAAGGGATGSSLQTDAGLVAATCSEPPCGSHCKPNQDTCPDGSCVPIGDDCAPTCGSGTKECLNSCIPNASCCNGCASPGAGTSTCVNGSCHVACNAGWKACGAVCIVNANCCSNADCHAPTNGASTCVTNGSAGGTCSMACNAGYTACGSQCIPNGTCCTTADCGQPPAGTGNSTCPGPGGTCVVTCNGGYRNCEVGGCILKTDCCLPQESCDDGDPCTYGDVCTGPSHQPGPQFQHCLGTRITCTPTACNQVACQGTSTCAVTPKTCTTTCGTAGTLTCDATALGGTRCGDATPETCDGIDNNCNGLVDEGGVCRQTGCIGDGGQ